jgi:hypothetical protein
MATFGHNLRSVEGVQSCTLAAKKAAPEHEPFVAAPLVW